MSNSNGTPQNNSYARYPERETLYVITGAKAAPFESAVVGITYPHPDYSIRRTAGNPITVLEYVLEGEGEITVEGRRFRATAGQMYLLRAHEAHHYRSLSQNPWKKLWINYQAPYISPYLDALGMQSFSVDCPKAKRHFENAFHAASESQPREELCRTVTDAVHNAIWEAHLALSHGGDDSDGRRIRSALDEALYTAVSLDEIALRLHISKSNLIRIFKKNYGVTPYEYLLEEKIKTAKLLLSNSHLTVSEIAQRLSVSDAHYFSTLFSHRVGMTPTEYRKQNQGND